MDKKIIERFSNDQIVIIEGNKLIIEFMGGTVNEALTVSGYPKMKIPDWAFMLNDYDKVNLLGYCYERSFDWLMPVVEKIEAIRDKEYGWFQVCIQSNTCTIQSQHWHKVLAGDNGNVKAYCSNLDAVYQTKIESTWRVIVAFITWLNANKTKDNGK